MKHLLVLARELGFTALFVLGLFGASRLVVENVQVHGASMFPTLQNNEYLLVDTVSYRFQPPHRGDIIIFRPPIDPTETYVKRIIGVPGDLIRVTNGIVSVNGQALGEPYLRMPHTYSWGPAHVPGNDLFVLGDNRDVSYDSHLWPAPFLPENQIIGRVLLSYWPPNDLRLWTPPALATGK